MADSSNSLMTPSKHKKKNKTFKNIDNIASQEATAVNSSPQQTVPSTSSGDLLRAMSGSDDITDLDNGKCSSTDNMLALTAKSPSKIMSENNAFMASLKKDSGTSTLAMLSLASCTKPVLSFQFLVNVIADPDKRRATLAQMFLALGVEDAARYAMFRQKSKHAVVVDHALIPPIGPSLRKWIDATNNINVQNLFLCVLQPDPLSNSSFVQMYLLKHAEDPTSAATLLQERVAEWIESQVLLSNVLTAALSKAEQAFANDLHHLKLIEQVKKAWSAHHNQMHTFGSAKFWSLKQNMHACSEATAGAIRDHINQYEMVRMPNGAPDYVTWVKKVNNLAEHLSEYDASGYDAINLFNLFVRKYQMTIASNCRPYDPVIKDIESGVLNWEQLVQNVDHMELNDSIVNRLHSILLDSDNKRKTALHIKAVPDDDDHTACFAGNSRSHQPAYKKAKLSGGKKDADVSVWSDSAPCHVHPEGHKGVQHTNAECYRQTAIRASLNTGKAKLVDCIANLNKVKKDYREAQARKGAKQSVGGKSSKKQPAKASVVRSIESYGYESSSSETGSDEDDARPAIPTAASAVNAGTRRRAVSFDSVDSFGESDVNSWKRRVTLDAPEMKSETNHITCGQPDSVKLEGSPYGELDILDDSGFKPEEDATDSDTVRERLVQEENRALRRARANAARKERKHARRAYVAKRAECESADSYFFTYKGRSVQSYAKEIVTKLRAGHTGEIINRAIDRFREAFYAQDDNPRFRDHLRPADYLIVAGLHRQDLDNQSKTVRNIMSREFKVSLPVITTPFPSHVLTFDQYSSCNPHTSKYVVDEDTIASNHVRSSRRRSIDKLRNRKLIRYQHTFYVSMAVSKISKALLANGLSNEFDTIIDTGASVHILKDICYATEKYKFRKSTSRVALGDHSVQLIAAGTCHLGILRKALIVPKMSLNLISGSRLEKDGYYLTVRSSKCNIHDHRGAVIFSAILHDGLYCCNLADLVKVCNDLDKKNIAAVAKVKKMAVISTKLDVELLHKRFGHASTEDIISGLKNGTIKGYTVDVKRECGKYQLQNGLCSVCMRAKAHKPPFYLSLSLKASAPGHYVVCDIQGPFGIETLLGEKYVVTYTDWYSRYSWTYLLKAKSDAFEKLKYLVEVIFAANRVVLRHYHSDQAGELHGSETVNYLERVVHATHSESEAYTPARNGIAERKFRTLSEMTAAMLFDSGLPKTFWGFAYLSATHVRNRIPTVTRDGSSTPRSPYELWQGHVPNIHYLRRWGCKCYVYIPKQHRTKTFPDKVMTGFLVGFTSTGSYDVYIPEREKVLGATIQVTFDENIPSHSESYFSELHLNDKLIDTTEPKKPMTAKDFEYLNGTIHQDDEDGLKYMTTRIVVKDGHIVAYRSPLKLNGERNIWEENIPIHVKDIARLTALTNSGTRRMETSGVGLIPGSVLADTLHTHPSDGVISKRKAATLPSLLQQHDISSPYNQEACAPSCESPCSTPYNLRSRKRVSFAHETDAEILSASNVTTPILSGHLTSQGAKGSTRLQPTSVFKIFHTMVENNEFDIDLTPKTYKQAMNSNNSHQWQEAINKELKSIADNNVFSIVPRPEGVKLQSGRFLFKIKYTGTNTVFKARLIAHGFKQVAGSDYWETYAPVTSCIATRIFLTMCATFKMIIHQMDIDTAFLIADLTEDLYMEPPVGMHVPEGMVLKLHKCLYGLKQSPRYFNQHLMNTLLNMDFENLINEPCLFHKMVNGFLVIATIYVDDILIACHDVDTIKSVKNRLKESYKMKDMGEMDWYLGMRCKRDKTSGSFTLDQTKYLEDVLTKFNLWIGADRTRTVPMQPNLVLSKWTPEHDANLTQKQEYLLSNFPYRQIIGSLLYASIWTRPEISFAVGKLAKFNNHPTIEAIHATQWLLQYMRGSKHLGLSFIEGDMRISTYVDSSFGDVALDKRSTAGQITYLGKSPIQWDSFVCDNYAVPCSVAEAEYLAASEAARVMLANRNILIQLGFPQDNMFMFEDNKACIAIAIQESSTRKTKHVELQVHHIRDLIKSGRINMIHITTNIQLADIFTKALTDEVFHRHLPVILGGEPSGDLQVYLRAKDDYKRSVDTHEDMSV